MLLGVDYPKELVTKRQQRCENEASLNAGQVGFTFTFDFVEREKPFGSVVNHSVASNSEPTLI